MNKNLTCPQCKNILVPGSKFCPNCGFQLEGAQTFTTKKKLCMYAVSILAPPFGLIYFFKYYHSDNPEIKKVGLIAGVLTIISFLLTIWWTFGFFQSIQSQINSYSSLGL